MIELADLWDCPTEALPWAAKAYCAGGAERWADGFAAGYAAAEADMARRWAAAASSVKRVLAMPTQAELSGRRVA